MDFLTDQTAYEIAGNELWRIFLLLVVIALAFLLGKVSKYFLNRVSPKLQSHGRYLFATAAEAASKSTTFLFFSFGLRIAFTFLVVPDAVQSLLFTSLELMIVLAIGHFFYRQIDVLDAWLSTFSEEESVNIDSMLIPIVGKSIRVGVVILVVLQAAQIMSDQPITSILAGIGIGGLALGLAAQDTIRNFFGSLMIFADKPFNVGELINLEDKLGVVQEVGVRTTKIKTLDGHILTVPNGNLANSTIHNIGKRPYIRRVFNVTITYGTPPDKIEQAIEILHSILDNHTGMEEEFPPRVFFDELNSDSLNIKCFYWFHPPDYWQYMEFTQTVNQKIIKQFNEAGIEFAFPTQTIHLAGDKKQPFDVGFRDQKSDENRST